MSIIVHICPVLYGNMHALLLQMHRDKTTAELVKILSLFPETAFDSRSRLLHLLQEREGWDYVISENCKKFAVLRVTIGSVKVG